MDLDWSRCDAVLTIGRRPVEAAGAVVVSSNGWVARLGTAPGITLPWRPTRANAIGSLAAACLGVGAIAIIVLKLPLTAPTLELSMFEHRSSPLGGLDFGPALPAVPLSIDAVVFGCEGVTNGLAYALRRLP